MIDFFKGVPTLGEPIKGFINKTTHSIHCIKQSASPSIHHKTKRKYFDMVDNSHKKGDINLLCQNPG